VLVHGLGIAGAAVARALLRQGHAVVLSDDAPNAAAVALADELGLDLVTRPDVERSAALLASASMLAPAPGVPETHPMVLAAFAAGVPVRTEIDLAHEWEQERPGGPRPMIAVTGTDGKTTTTMMVASLLAAAGYAVAAVGNTERPLIDALDDDVEVFAVECSSFRLAWLSSFRAEAAVWLNFAPDHLNWHRSLASYEQAKANVWRLQRPDDVALGWAVDPVVRRHLAEAPARHVTFALGAADYHRPAGDPTTGDLVGPNGPVGSSARLVRRFPHDLSNALAAIAACLESGLVAADQVDAGLAAFRFPPHRIEPVTEIDGVHWYNDSKATTPHAALTAIRSFESQVLIAGGRNKGLDLSSLASEHERVRAVVAIGEAAGEVERAFAGLRSVVRAASMAEAVSLAAGLARPGDAVLLSPACASFDWYPDGGYPARGADFVRLVNELATASGSPS
jgi:UDP-N-acetylmuramoylalanine--D-glutamate ligase